MGLYEDIERMVRQGGDYFQSDDRWWHPIWYTVREIADLDGVNAQKGLRHEGELIEARLSLHIAGRLEALLQDQQRWAEWVEVIRDRFGTLPGQPPEMAVCRELGLYPSPQKTNVPFSKGELEDFTVFCRDSGGFRVY